MTIAVDSSALLCVLLGEADSERVAEALDQSLSTIISAPVLLEARIVTEARLGPLGVANLDLLLSTASIKVVPFSESEAQAAMAAWRRFGEGNHRAGLNFGDCMSYATAVIADAPLLFVGDDFARTDVVAA